MRVTTQMLANSAAKSGMPLHRTTLLDTMNHKSSSGSLSGIGSQTNATNLLNKNNYSKLEDAAESLSKYADKLAAADKDSIFAKAEETGNTKEILTDVNKMVEEYNVTLKQLRTTGGTMSHFYQQQLKEIPSECKEILKSIGITQAKDGSLSVNEKILENADIDTLRKTVGSESGFASKVSFVSNCIKENAVANIASASNQYTANGSSYRNSFETNKYNFFG